MNSIKITILSKICFEQILSYETNCLNCIRVLSTNKEKKKLFFKIENDSSDHQITVNCKLVFKLLKLKKPNENKGFVPHESDFKTITLEPNQKIEEAIDIYSPFATGDFQLFLDCEIYQSSQFLGVKRNNVLSLRGVNDNNDATLENYFTNYSHRSTAKKGNEYSLFFKNDKVLPRIVPAESMKSQSSKQSKSKGTKKATKKKSTEKFIVEEDDSDHDHLEGSSDEEVVSKKITPKNNFLKKKISKKIANNRNKISPKKSTIESGDDESEEEEEESFSEKRSESEESEEEEEIQKKQLLNDQTQIQQRSNQIDYSSPIESDDFDLSDDMPIVEDEANDFSSTTKQRTYHKRKFDDYSYANEKRTKYDDKSIEENYQSFHSSFLTSDMFSDEQFNSFDIDSLLQDFSYETALQQQFTNEQLTSL